ncbi:MAG: MarR family transcriptional regulator [Geminicoccaceae bacterium]
MDDIVRDLGLLALGTRLKRLGERLQAETQGMLDGLEPKVPASQHPLLAAIDRFGSLSVGQLAETLGVTQPGITRAVGDLVEQGLVEVAAAPEDGRRRMLTLTAAGRVLVDAAKAQAWPGVERAVGDLCDGFGDELLQHLAVLEDRLAERPLRVRGRSRS